MITQDQQNQGTGLTGFLRGEVQGPGMDAPANSIAEGQNIDTYFEYKDELIAVSSTVPGGKTDYSPTGTPAFAIVSNGVGGQVTATLAADNAAMIAGISWDDNLQIDGDNYFCVEHRVKFADAVVENEYALIGVAGTIESGVNPGTLAGLEFAGFYLDGDMNLKALIMGSDGSDVDEDTGFDVSADTWYWYKVELDQFGSLNLYFGPGYGEDGALVYAVTDDFSQALQPVALIGKSTGTTEPAIYVDTQKVRGYRAADG